MLETVTRDEPRTREEMWREVQDTAVRRFLNAFNRGDQSACYALWSECIWVFKGESIYALAAILEMDRQIHNEQKEA